MKKEHGEMIESRKVNSTRQKGIERVLQRGKVDKTWQEGSMGLKGKGSEKNWKRSDGSLVPRKA